MAVDIQGYNASGLSGGIIHGAGGFLKGDDNKWGVSMYYRNPFGFRDGQESLWISYDDTDPYLIMRKLKKGFQLLDAYGQCPGLGAPDNHGQRHHEATELWTPILAHPMGPAEFPASQIKTYRWYNAMNLPGSLQGRKIRFPQLLAGVQSGEITLKEIPCLQCTRATFFEPWHLARHLINAHGYTMERVFAVGEKMGVDFSRSMEIIFQPATETDLSSLYQENDMNDPYDAAIAGASTMETRHLPPNYVVPQLPYMQQAINGAKPQQEWPAANPATFDPSAQMAAMQAQLDRLTEIIVQSKNGDVPHVREAAVAAAKSKTKKSHGGSWTPERREAASRAAKERLAAKTPEMVTA